MANRKKKKKSFLSAVMGMGQNDNDGKPFISNIARQRATERRLAGEAGKAVGGKQLFPEKKKRK